MFFGFVLIFVRRRVGSNDFCSKIDASEASSCSQARGFQDSPHSFSLFLDGIRVGFMCFLCVFVAATLVSC